VTTYTVLDRRRTEPAEEVPVRRALFQDDQENQPAGANRWVEDSDSDDDDEWRQPPANDWGPAQNQEVDGAW